MFICSKCQKEYTKWSGKCENCQSWNTIIESESTLFKGTKNKKKDSKIVEIYLNNLEKNTLLTTSEIKTGILEFANTLGGRLVAWQVILLAGSPGI